jgi:N-acetylglucosaminyldiphosphoundecaprenol N-acetyl-beta-D-mannosaminyltransferase
MITAPEPIAAATVLGTDVDAIDMTRAIECMRTLLLSKPTAYVCVAGVHGVMEARRCPSLAAAYSNAALIIPDGMPLVWVGHLQGHKSMQRVTGPDFMLEIFRRPEFRKVTHFLYGGDTGVAQQLKFILNRRFPNVRITGAATPPFRELSGCEQAALIAEIRHLKPDIIWIGLGCPRQELFMQQYSKLLDTRVLVGVGAAFDYHTGRIRDSADWVKKAGLQWVHRLIQDPRRLWRRYLRNNPPFIWQVTRQLIREQMFAPAPLPSSLHTVTKVKDETLASSTLLSIPPETMR